jgi:hypothetical protein
MSDTIQVLLDQLSAEIDALLRVNKKGDYQCVICGRLAATADAIEHTGVCNWEKLTELLEQLRDALEQGGQ